MFMVATIHISPRSPDDVDAVIASPNVAADTVMIELDDERLDKMRDWACQIQFLPSKFSCKVPSSICHLYSFT